MQAVGNQPKFITQANKLGLIFRTKIELFYFLASTCKWLPWLLCNGLAPDACFFAFQTLEHRALLAHLGDKFLTFVGNVYLPSPKKIDIFFLKQIINGEKQVRHLDLLPEMGAPLHQIVIICSSLWMIEWRKHLCLNSMDYQWTNSWQSLLQSYHLSNSFRMGLH